MYKLNKVLNDEDAAEGLSTQDIGMIMRRIANVLETGETVSAS